MFSRLRIVSLPPVIEEVLLRVFRFLLVASIDDATADELMQVLCINIDPPSWRRLLRFLILKN